MPIQKGNSNNRKEIETTFLSQLLIKVTTFQLKIMYHNDYDNIDKRKFDMIYNIKTYSLQ